MLSQFIITYVEFQERFKFVTKCVFSMLKCDIAFLQCVKNLYSMEYIQAASSNSTSTKPPLVIS